MPPLLLLRDAPRPLLLCDAPRGVPLRAARAACLAAGSDVVDAETVRAARVLAARLPVELAALVAVAAARRRPEAALYVPRYSGWPGVYHAYDSLACSPRHQFTLQLSALYPVGPSAQTALPLLPLLPLLPPAAPPPSAERAARGRAATALAALMASDPGYRRRGRRGRRRP
jgi:hypothetical protein